MEIDPQAVKEIVAKFSRKLELAAEAKDTQALYLIGKTLACTANQLAAVNAPWSEQKVTTEELLKAQAAIMVYEKEGGND